MRISKRLLTYILCASLLFIPTGCTKNNKTHEDDQPKISKNWMDMSQKQLMLDTILKKLNNKQDLDLLTDKFKKIILVQDPLYELKPYEGAYKTTNDSLQSTAYGLEGTYKVSEKTHLHIRIIFDDTDINGGYISNISSNTAETSIFRYKDFFIIFETTVNSTDKSVITSELNESKNFKMRFYNMLKNIKEIDSDLTSIK